MARSSAHEEVTVRSHRSSASFVVRVPASDIDSCIHVSILLLFVTAVAILLAVTDIPRTGLTFSARNHTDPVAPGVATYFGPYDYHVSHLRLETNVSSRRNHLNVSGSCDDERIDSLELWSYKQDTLSIAPRALAEYLNVTAYPACVLYKGFCLSLSLDLVTVFTMFDDLIDSVHTKLFTNTTGAGLPFEFATTSYWIDRLHHYFIFTFTQITDVRFHQVYRWISRSNSSSISDPRTICAHDSAPLATTPLFCRDTIRWVCSLPTNSSNDELLPIWDHIAVRFDDLQRRYQGLELDFTMFISTMAEQSRSNVPVLPSVTILTDALEITTLIRGRQCDHRGCLTVFIDDYRYERGVIESDEDNRALYVTIWRGLAQSYVWLRVVMLAWGCYAGRSREPKYHERSVLIKLAVACSTMLKIPGHVIVYGSWFPIVGYSVAHFYDSGLVQSLGEFEWSSVNGFFKFNVVDYVLAASIQMRNIWMIVLAWKLVFTLLSRSASGQSISLHLTHHGVLTVRSGWIGLISWLTTFSMVRALHFRDTNILEIVPLPRHTSMTTLHTQRNLNDYGLQFDFKCCLASLLLVGGFGILFETIVRHTTDQDTSIFFCRSFYVPYSAGTLWSWSALDMFWPVQFHSDTAGPRMEVIPGGVHPPSSPRRQVPSPTSVVPADSVSQHRISDCRQCNFRSSMTHWLAAQGCPHHESIFDVHNRTKALWSIVRLMNIANMTDPIALFRLYVTGRQLYLYRVTSANQKAYSILLPTAMERSDVTKKTRKLTMRWPISEMERNADSDATFELLQIVDSRDVPWHVLVNCG